MLQDGVCAMQPATYTCMDLVLDKTFKHALAVPLPLDKNCKFTPKSLIDKAAVEQYGVISGLKSLIDANEMVRQLYNTVLYLS
jgi:hypothetical protein